MQEQSLCKRIFTAVIILIIAVIIIVPIAIGMGIVGIPLWAFILPLFYHSSIESFNPDKLKNTLVGGALGIFVGMSQGIFTQLFGSSLPGILCFAALALAFCTAFIVGSVPWVSTFGVFMMTLITLFSLEPCIWAGVPASIDMGSVEAFVRVMVSYAIASALLSVISAVIKKKANTQE